MYDITCQGVNMADYFINVEVYPAQGLCFDRLRDMEMRVLRDAPLRDIVINKIDTLSTKHPGKKWMCRMLAKEDCVILLFGEAVELSTMMHWITETIYHDLRKGRPLTVRKGSTLLDFSAINLEEVEAAKAAIREVICVQS
jgi:hypothetical protein